MYNHVQSLAPGYRGLLSGTEVCTPILQQCPTTPGANTLQLSHPMSTGQLLMPWKVRRICFAGAVATSNWPSMQEAWQDEALN